MGNKNAKPYNVDALQHLVTCIKLIRRAPTLKVNLEGLEKSVKVLPKVHRERIEKFWGLTGGINHSKKMAKSKQNDIAYIDMYKAAVVSLREILKTESIVMYDEQFADLIERLVRKLDRTGTNISDMEAVKYLMVFFVFVWNGPKMSFEENPEEVDLQTKGDLFFDEYEMLRDMSNQMSKLPDESINLRMLIDFLEIIDYKDSLTIKKSMGIQFDDKLESEHIDEVRTLIKVRQIKEKIFPYGAWEVAQAIILGDTGINKEIKVFMEKLNDICKDWSTVYKFCTASKHLRTSTELRKMNVYNIGGLEFTDPYEIMFLYLERNFIKC